MGPEDRQLIINFGIMAIIATVCIVAAFFILVVVFFYGNPLTIILCSLLIIFRIKICDSGVEISLVKILRKYIKISVTIME